MYDVRKILEDLADEKFKDFSLKLIPTNNNILGVKIPQLRTITREMPEEDKRPYIDHYNCEYLEELIIKGLLIGQLNGDIQEILSHVDDFTSSIDNWLVCDCFCSGLKVTKKNMETVWEFIQPYLYSDDEFKVRFAVVMMLDHYICEDYIDQVIAALDSVKHDGYYVKMAVAWAVSVCFVKFSDKTMKYLKYNNLDDWTYNKSIQKIIESRRVDDMTKDSLRKMRRK
ncbi:DNA alkylation repair protein [Candidatus Methanomassiliicoccus intestinalis]|uniref:DNA alkylation repair protein n=1 Tax=Candidatus Methanomassiliicoccus intestinalis TaxID=1406512 RepID=UPI0037DD76C5